MKFSRCVRGVFNVVFASIRLHFASITNSQLNSFEQRRVPTSVRFSWNIRGEKVVAKCANVLSLRDAAAAAGRHPPRLVWSVRRRLRRGESCACPHRRRNFGWPRYPRDRPAGIPEPGFPAPSIDRSTVLVPGPPTDREPIPDIAIQLNKIMKSIRDKIRSYRHVGYDARFIEIHWNRSSGWWAEGMFHAQGNLTIPIRDASAYTRHSKWTPSNSIGARRLRLGLGYKMQIQCNEWQKDRYIRTMLTQRIRSLILPRTRPTRAIVVHWGLVSNIRSLYTKLWK